MVLRREVAHFFCRNLPSEKIVLYLHLQNITTPPISNCLRNVPITLAQRKLTIKQNCITRPVGANNGRILEYFLNLVDITINIGTMYEYTNNDVIGTA
ncbi:hypothetical protein HMPREF9304_12220 [Hoylesella timonensis S9-PR14]|uniref:Uncharacterized protein n=1 Tax=Hoylesella timonensis S9-PR14 TaxID=1401062 RepID=A0A098YPA7_9BACT|nr:hypothetical protein HMPREF9304_12220 [Hoylesella timonensis S9-PR14]